MSDLQRLAALVQAERQGLLQPEQQAALNELRTRAQQKNQTLAGYIEPLISVGSSAIAEPVSGFVGLAGLPFGVDVSANAIQRTQDALTFKPKTAQGQKSLQTVGEVLAPVGQAIEGASTYLGDKTLEATGSPALATAAYSLPTVALEAIGLKGAGKIPGKQFEFGDIHGQAFGQRGAVGGVIEPFTSTTGYKEIDAAAGDVVNMSPDDYLRMAYEATDKQVGGDFEGWLRSNARTPEETAGYSARMLEGDKFPMAYVNFRDGSQDGRNRALAAKQAGVELMPVKVIQALSPAERIEEIRRELLDAKGYRKHRLQEEMKRLESEV